MATSHPATSPGPPRPQSPGVGGVPLSSAIGDLLRFVLSSHAAAGAAPDDNPAGFPLSPSYCARLLDDGDMFWKLAAGIQRCLEEGRLPGPPEVVGIPGEEGPQEEWETVLLEKGAELKLDTFANLKHVILQLKPRQLKGVRKYSSFSEMLQAEIISNVLPGISSIEEGVKVYRKFYTQEKEITYGVLAISVSKPSAQPYITMTDILAGLGYDGLSRLLGMAKTAGTVPDGLPPPRSALISSCMRLHQPNVMAPDGLKMVQRYTSRSFLILEMIDVSSGC
ncbi:hypothetical protein BAE44_0001578 [Dichanthelium oligosanthes]|uniref:ASCH domain-containing protein n=1 Tax=Dichanthelium oligosanthes TaxID=888268 RepID=A0A1E5WJ27_9POAL|nr:hypothetical protein BAE44_0001578 [Dichanthelium oligosanthes]